MSTAILRRLAPVPILALAVLTVGCGTDVGSGPRQRPTGRGEVVVQVLVDDGFVPAEVRVTAVPSVTVLGDGTVITPAPIPAIYPGPAITPLQSVTVDVAAVDRLVGRADELGLLDGPLDFGQPPVTDTPQTTVTITARGATHRHVANGLGIGDGAAGGAGVDDRRAANRQALAAFVDATQSLPPGERAWVPSTIAVYDLGAYHPDPQPAPESLVEQGPLTWPLAQPPATGDGFPPPCTLVEPDDTRVLQESLSRANARTPWVVDGQQRSLAFRPVVPGQPGCPS